MTTPAKQARGRKPKPELWKFMGNCDNPDCAYYGPVVRLSDGFVACPKHARARRRKPTGEPTGAYFTVKISEWEKMSPATKRALADMFCCLAKQLEKGKRP